MDIDEQYQSVVKKFDAAITKTSQISTAVAGRANALQPVWWACLLYTRLCATGVSLLSLVPKSRFSGIGHYNFSVVASIAPDVWECYFTFFYIGIDTIEDDEWMTRLKLLQLHNCKS
jgi:hypothetical protein